MNEAVYFMGTSSGTSKKGNDFWCVLLLWINSFGNYEIKSCFCNKDFYDDVNKLGMARGTAVDISVTLGGGISSVAPSKRFAPLNLGEVLHK